MINKQALIIGRGKEIDPTTYEGQRKRLLNKYTPEKVDFIEEIEEEFQTTTETMKGGQLFAMLWGEMQRKAVFYERHYSGYRISRHDFESAFLIEFTRIVKRTRLHGKSNPNYTFYETFKQALKFRAIDVVRNVTGQRNKQTRFEVEAIPLQPFHDNEIFAGVIIPDRTTMEKRTESRLLLNEIIQSDKLTQNEIKLLNAMSYNPDGSQRQMAKACGFPHNYTVKRTLDGIRRKFPYCNPFK